MEYHIKIIYFCMVELILGGKITFQHRRTQPLLTLGFFIKHFICKSLITNDYLNYY